MPVKRQSLIVAGLALFIAAWGIAAMVEYRYKAPQQRHPITDGRHLISLGDYIIACRGAGFTEAQCHLIASWTEIAPNPAMREGWWLETCDLTQACKD
jgi:hypothetical protein